MIIRIASLHDGLNSWNESIEPSELELDDKTFSSIISVCVNAEKLRGKIEITVDAVTDYKFVCNRCGEDGVLRVNDKASVHFIQRESPFPDEMPGDELRSYFPGQTELDIRTEIRDALLLAVPMKLLCREDCKGICQGCGANLNNEECRCK